MKKINPQTSKGPAGRFMGDAYPTIILSGEKPSHVRMGSVHFAPGARTAWHSHAVGQYLHIIEGTALVQERGGEIQELHAGKTIYTEPGVEHWHGASRDSFMVHLAIWEASDSGAEETTWGEHVSDAEYHAK
ncbi:MAG TPA: cupin domain-containing protein [Candidatus Saccharimonadaceae bacterium]|nr:cupin domain-containing protein [Candidatus Saccharimonadaceae bacterium]